MNTIPYLCIPESYVQVGCSWPGGRICEWFPCGSGSHCRYACFAFGRPSSQVEKWCGNSYFAVKFIVKKPRPQGAVPPWS